MNVSTLSADVAAPAHVNASDAPPLPSARKFPNSRNGLDGELDPVPRKLNRSPYIKRAALVALLVFVGIGVAALTYHWFAVTRFIESTDDAYIGGDVTVIAPEVAGFIAKISVADNQHVQAGDLLLKLDDRDYHAALAKAAAAVAIQQAALTNLDATRHWQEAVVAQARADIAAADAKITLTHDDQLRYQHLSASGTESVQSFEDADTAYKQALAAGEKTRAGLAAAERQLDVIETQKQEAQAALEGAIAERDAARLNLGYTELRAPIEGTVGNRSAQTGAYATAGSQLISLIPARGLWVDANFKEDQLARIRPGSPATVAVDAIPGKKFHGHVVSIAPATGAQFSVLPPENATGNFTKIVQRVTVRIALDDEAAAIGQLRPGLSVTAKVNTREKAGL